MALALLELDVETDTDAVFTLMNLVRAEYREMPGLSVTLPQAQRLWGVDKHVCAEAFSRLTGSGVLKKTASGRFVSTRR